MQKSSKWLTVLAAIVLLLFAYRVIIEFDKHCSKKPNPEFKRYIELQQKQLDSVLTRLGEEGIISTSKIELQSPSRCFTSNFEGAEVLVVGLQHHDSIYGTESRKPYYTYGCNYVLFDPDHPIYGLPDIEMRVGPVGFYQPELNGLEKLAGLGINSKPRPYRVFRKPVYDSTGKKLNVFEMQLWLTQFKVALTVVSDRDKPQVSPDNESMKVKKYPGKWYSDTRPMICINDLKDKEEYMNHRYGDITFILEVNPNASPWYIKGNNQQTLRPDIAVGAIVCNEMVKRPEKENQIHINIQKGMLAPLYLDPFETNANLNDLNSDELQLAEKLEEYRRFNIWNRKYYFKIHSKNIGARKTGILWNAKTFDEQIEFTFLLPLLVVGNWDVQLPWEVIPTMEAPQPYYKSFSIKNLLPDWGLGGIGKGLSSLILVGLAALCIFWLLPFFRR
ncbi:MAG: hypothetical protein WHS63_03065 [Tenuifilum sp.]|uniref:hypothetical protein n=1 Tax=Tenuifilum sp. TaxID=2760880 RepID=UPI0030B61861